MEVNRDNSPKDDFFKKAGKGTGIPRIIFVGLILLGLVDQRF
ncbi:hypothetical protein AAKU67_000353 [Oxalobacteraceae bacterium GrIS 2.11]